MWKGTVSAACVGVVHLMYGGVWYEPFPTSTTTLAGLLLTLLTIYTVIFHNDKFDWCAILNFTLSSYIKHCDNAQSHITTAWSNRESANWQMTIQSRCNQPRRCWRGVISHTNKWCRHRSMHMNVIWGCFRERAFLVRRKTMYSCIMCMMECAASAPSVWIIDWFRWRIINCDESE